MHAGESSKRDNAAVALGKSGRIFALLVFGQKSASHLHVLSGQSITRLEIACLEIESEGGDS